MEFKVENGDGIDSWKEVTLVYSAALRQMETKMQILNDEFQHVHQYNPIEHIKARIKTPESIVKKLKRYGQESTIDNMVKYKFDQAKKEKEARKKQKTIDTKELRLSPNIDAHDIQVKVKKAIDDLLPVCIVPNNSLYYSNIMYRSQTRHLDNPDSVCG